MSETKEICLLIADLAKAAAAWEGGVNQGVAYCSYNWRKKLEEIATRADRLAGSAGGSPNV